MRYSTRQAVVPGQCTLVGGTTRVLYPLVHCTRPDHLTVTLLKRASGTFDGPVSACVLGNEAVASCLQDQAFAPESGKGHNEAKVSAQRRVAAEVVYA